MRYSTFVRRFHQRIYTVIHILLNTIVHTALAVAASRSVIINTQSASAIDKLDVEAHSMQLDIELCNLSQCCTDSANLCNLASDMEVNQLQAITQSHLVKQF